MREDSVIGGRQPVRYAIRMKVRVLSLNAGLLKLLGRSFPTPFVPERAAALASQIRDLECDIVLLQEIYGSALRKNLAESLRDVLPYAVYPRKRRHFGLQNGLMALSRYQATGSVELFRDTPLDETWFDSKGILVTQHRLGSGITLTVVNLHVTAGGFFGHPEDPRIDKIRSQQIEQILEHVCHLNSPLIVAGDLNAGPGVSEVNFLQLLDADFVSIHDLLHPGTPEVTWDPLNSLNSGGPHKICPPQRIDHVFIPTKDYGDKRILPLSSAICLQDPVVQVEGTRAVSVSDHYGICVEIDVSSDASSDSTSGTT
jgi:endonuclease/exonuclease/phosphatase family metal-dependent hydrolase